MSKLRLSVIAVVALAAPAVAAAPNPAASLALASGTVAVAQTGDAGGATTAPRKSRAGTIALVGLGAAAVIGGAVALGSSGHHGTTAASN